MTILSAIMTTERLLILRLNAFKDNRLKSIVSSSQLLVHGATSSSSPVLSQGFIVVAVLSTVTGWTLVHRWLHTQKINPLKRSCTCPLSFLHNSEFSKAFLDCQLYLTDSTLSSTQYWLSYSFKISNKVGVTSKCCFGEMLTTMKKEV